jgi:hypothetical protein
MNEGDPVWYRQIIPGGYGFGADIPATFVRATAKRLIVRVTLRYEDESKDIAVLPTNVRPRTTKAWHE